MIKSGLVSVTFRSRTAADIIRLASAAGIDGIEWGGDLHVPHGDTVTAAKIARMTQDAGLEVAAYGSYYRAGVSEQTGLPFSAVVETAVELGAPLIRVWAGPSKPLDQFSTAELQAVVDDALRIADISSAAGITTAFEYHANSLTETNDSAVRLLKQTEHPWLKSYWQPPNGRSPDYCLDGLLRILPRLAHLHIFHWVNRQQQFPLSEGETVWNRYLEPVRQLPGERYALLEFVRNDDENQFMEDARVLRRWLTPG